MGNDLVSLGGEANASRWISVLRAVSAVVIPDGYPTQLEMNEQVRLTQQLGDSFTVMNVRGQLFRIAGEDADAIGKEKPKGLSLEGLIGKPMEDIVWEVLRTCYDPEIPANVVDLGLVYSVTVNKTEADTYAVAVAMTLTAPGCGMSGVLKQDVETKIARIPNVASVNVEITFDPPWTQERMSEAARLQLGFL